jgi:hypothetical protein
MAGSNAAAIHQDIADVWVSTHINERSLDAGRCDHAFAAGCWNYNGLGLIAAVPGAERLGRDPRRVQLLQPHRLEPG